MGVRDGDSHNSKDSQLVHALETTETPENSQSHMNQHFSPKTGGRMNSPNEVHLYQYTQCGQQTGGAGIHCGRWKTII